jgi:hypothetical protein
LVARRLTLGELGDLVGKHGGFEGAIAARPDLEDTLRAAEASCQAATRAIERMHMPAIATGDMPLLFSTVEEHAAADVPILPDTALTADAIVEAFERISKDAVPPPTPGQKSRWHPVTLKTITQRLAAGESARSIGPGVGIRHQRISELHARGDTYWDTEKRELVLPAGTTKDSRTGFYVLPPAPPKRRRVRK